MKQPFNLSPTFLDTEEGRDLLHRAERYLDGQSEQQDNMAKDDIRSLIQRLRVYQIELEMQNEELKQTQDQVERSRFRYIQLFEYCPVGLAIITRNGILQKVNRTLACIMGKNCLDLVGRSLHELLVKDSEQLFLGRFRAFFNNPDQKEIKCICLPGQEGNQILKMEGMKLEAPRVIKGLEPDDDVLLVSFQDITKEEKLQQEIARSRNELDQIFQSAIPLQVINLDFCLTRVNQAFCRFLGQREENLIGKLCYEVWPSPFCQTEQCALRRIQHQEDCCEGEKDLFLPEETRRCLIKTTANRNQNGILQGVVMAVLDITDRTRAEEELTLSEERFRSIVENTSDLILAISQDGDILFANQAFQETLGYPPKKISTLQFSDICHRDFLAHCQSTFQKILNGRVSQSRIETIFRSVHDHEIQVEGTVNIQIDKRHQRKIVLGIFRDISLHKSVENQLRTMSVTDELTGLQNRRGFMEEATGILTEAEEQNDELTLIYVDLDGMKEINDNFGHSAGDQALMDVADVLRTVFRKEDLIGRIGGDEFVILFAPGQDMPETSELGSRLNESAFRICYGRKRPYKLSMSIGADTFVPNSGITLEQLLSKADAAMYSVKEKQKERRNQKK